MSVALLSSLLLSVITGTMFPGPILGVIPGTEKSYEQAVLPPFEDGLNSLTSAAETLLTSTDLLQGFENVRQLLVSSHDSLSEAEQKSLAQVKALGTNAEERRDTIKRLNDEETELKARKQVLEVQLSGLQEQESLARQQLQAAEDALRNAKNALDRADQAWHAAESDMKRGIGLIFIPLVGPIIGGITISKAIEAKNNAGNNFHNAQSMVFMHEEIVHVYESQIQSYREEIRYTEQRLSANTEEIQVLHRVLNSELELYEKLKSFLIPLRKCTGFLSTLAGKTSAANVYLELSGELDGLLGVLHEIVVTLRPLVESSTDYSLLISNRLPTIIHKLEEVNRRLNEAAAS